MIIFLSSHYSCVKFVYFSRRPRGFCRWLPCWWDWDGTCVRFRFFSKKNARRRSTLHNATRGSRLSARCPRFKKMTFALFFFLPTFALFLKDKNQRQQLSEVMPLHVRIKMYFTQLFECCNHLCPMIIGVIKWENHWHQAHFSEID